MSAGLSNEDPFARAEKYVDVPKDATLVSVTKYFDRQLGKGLRSLRYKVSDPHEHLIVLKLDASTGELLFYYDTSKRCTERVRTDIRISLDEAKERALDFIKSVLGHLVDLRLERAELLHSQGCGGRMYYEYWFEWNRVINGVEVIGEKNLRVIVHASSGDVVVYNKQWFGEQPINTEIGYQRTRLLSWVENIS